MDYKECKSCASQIPIKAKVCPHCRKSQGFRLSFLSWTFISIFILIVISIAVSANKSTSSFGDSGKLNSGGNLVPIAATQKSFDEWTKLRAAKDQEGQIQMIAAGDVFTVKKGTEVTVIDSGMFSRRIRIKSGPLKGMSGWVPTEYIQAKNNEK